MEAGPCLREATMNLVRTSLARRRRRGRGLRGRRTASAVGRESGGARKGGTQGAEARYPHPDRGKGSRDAEDEGGREGGRAVFCGAEGRGSGGGLTPVGERAERLGHKVRPRGLGSGGEGVECSEWYDSGGRPPRAVGFPGGIIRVVSRRGLARNESVKIGTVFEVKNPCNHPNHCETIAVRLTTWVSHGRRTILGREHSEIVKTLYTSVDEL